MKNIIVKDKIINITGINDDDFVCLTDIAKFINNDDPRYPIQNWMRLKDTIDFLGFWETLNNENFNRVEFDAFKNEYGRNSFVMTPTKWINKTRAIGIKTKAGKYGGGTFAPNQTLFVKINSLSTCRLSEGVELNTILFGLSRILLFIPFLRYVATKTTPKSSLFVHFSPSDDNHASVTSYALPHSCRHTRDAWTDYVGRTFSELIND